MAIELHLNGGPFDGHSLWSPVVIPVRFEYVANGVPALAPVVDQSPVIQRAIYVRRLEKNYDLNRWEYDWVGEG